MTKLFYVINVVSKKKHDTEAVLITKSHKISSEIAFIMLCIMSTAMSFIMFITMFVMSFTMFFIIPITKSLTMSFTLSSIGDSLAFCLKTSGGLLVSQLRD